MAVAVAVEAWAVLVLAATTLAYVWFRIAFRERLTLIAKIPGPIALPLLGHMYLVKSSATGLFKYCIEQSKFYPRIAKIGFMHRFAVGIWDPDDAEVILSSSKHIDKAKEYRFFQPWLGNGLLISTGDTWRHHRRLIAPTFHANVLKQFVFLFNRNSVALCDKLDAVEGQTIDAHDYMSETTVEILLETAMGVDRSTQKNGHEYAMAVMEMCLILQKRQTRPWLWPDAFFSLSSDGRDQKKVLHTIHELTRQVLKKRYAERKAGVREGLYKRVGTQDAEAEGVDNDLNFGQGLRDDLDDDVGEKKRVAFLDQMLDSAEEDGVISDQEVEEQVNTIMFEGHDTTAAASSFFLAIMGVHHDIQERCVAELRTIFGESQRPASFQDTLHMKYLERCILETLRLFPPVPIVARHLTENVPLKSGYVIPEGVTVVIGQFLLHRDPKVYPNPDEYDPDNFLPERCADRHYYSFVPFSAGPRSCVGRKYAMLKLKILLSTILRRFHVRADIAEKDFQLTGDIILKRAEGHPVRLYRRRKLDEVRGQ